MKTRFEVSTEGMRELQAGREPWQLAKELVSNAWDEKTTVCEVKLYSISSMTAYLSVYDDGEGFKDIKDAWTLMKHTDKRLDPEMRGRFNTGEKEILAVAQEAMITTAGKIIRFPKSGGRNVTKDYKESKGTLVEVWLTWGTKQVRETAEKLSRMMPPQGITYTVNGIKVEPQTPYKIAQAVLETVLQTKPGEPLTSARRKATVEIYRNPNGDANRLFEIGIPVQEIDCPYSVNVMQKIPLPPNRDTVKSSYLQDIYAIVLNAVADEVTDAAANWTRVAIEDKSVMPEAVQTIVTKRYGDKVALWSANGRSNDKALAAGYELVHGRTLSAKEREVFAGIGVQHASDIFPTSAGNREYYDESKLTDGMKRVRQYAKQLYRGLFPITSCHRDLSVRFYCDIHIRESASYGTGELDFNIGDLGKAWFDEIGENTTSLLLHEFAHTKGIGHEPTYYRSLEDLAGRAVHLALDKPEIFKVEVRK